MDPGQDLKLAPSAKELASRGRVCPKCSHVRQPTDAGPAWQCPRCGIVYDKYLTGAEAERAAERAAERRRKQEVQVIDGTRRWPWLLAAVVLAAGGWGAWKWQQGHRSKASAEALSRAAQVDQARQQQQMELELKVAWREYRGVQPARAMEIFTKYAAQGNTRAMALVGLAQDRANHARRMEWLHKAANEGEALAFVNLGYIYERGEGEPRQVDAADNWYSKAARQGNASGLYSLGRLYAYGPDGHERNPRQAFLLLELAARAYDRSADKNDYAMPHDRSGLGSRALQMSLEKELSPVDVVKARELADAWKPGQPLPKL